MMRLRLFIACLSGSALLAGCPLEEDDPTIPQPISPYTVAGSYSTNESWDLSSPLTGDGIAGLAADLVVYAVVNLTGVPSALEEQAQQQIEELIHEPIRAQVSAALPADLLPESGLWADVGAILSSVEVEGTLLLVAGDDPNELSGHQRVDIISVQHADTVYSLSIPELLDGAGLVDISADMAVSVVFADAVEVSVYELEIRLGRLVELVVAELLSAIDMPALTQQIADAIGCAQIIDTITGGAPTFDIEIAGENFSVESDTLDGACQDVRTRIAEYVLGMFDRDTGVSFSGPLRMTETDGDDQTDGLSSTTGYGGLLTKTPLPVPVPFSATVSATRQ